MRNGYYIYLDQRDVGKGDMDFAGWINYNEKPGESIPIFSSGEHHMIFKEKSMADKAAEEIARSCPEIEGRLHVEPCEEVPFND